MFIKLATPLKVLFNSGGYGSFVINLEQGIQEVDEKLGEFIFNHHYASLAPAEEDSVQTETATVQDESETATETTEPTEPTDTTEPSESVEEVQEPTEQVSEESTELSPSEEEVGESTEVTETTEEQPLDGDSTQEVTQEETE